MSDQLVAHFTDLEAHFAARERLPRGHAACDCCEGTGAHGSHPCDRCEGLGHLPQRQAESAPYCPRTERRGPRRRRSWREFQREGAGEYRQPHQGPDAEDGEALHELGTKGTYPSDLLHNLRDYGVQHEETAEKVYKHAGRPYSKVTIFRSLPSPHREINTGDWVATAAAYARQHGRDSHDPAKDWPVVKASVRADQIRNDGNSLEEWSYHGPPIHRAVLHFGGGAEHKGKSGRGRTDSETYEHEPPEMQAHYGDMLRRGREQRREWQEKRDAWNRGEGPHPGQFRFQAAAVPEYRHKPEHDWKQVMDLRDQGRDEEASALHERFSDEEHAWRRSIRNGLSLGHLTNEQALGLGYHGRGHDQSSYQAGPNWKPLPHDLYHATTDMAGVRRHGLLAPDEREGFRPTGLGGSENDSISLTSSRPRAENILRTMREYHHALNADPHELWERARRGDQGSKPFHRDLARYHDREWQEGQPLPRELRHQLEGIRGHHEFATQQEMDEKEGPGWHPAPGNEPYITPDKRTFHFDWEREATPQEKLHQRSDLFKHFTAYRGWAGGPENPTFMGNDPEAFSKLDPSNFGVVHLHPHPGAQGYPLPAEDEYRITTGKAVYPHHWQHEAALAIRLAGADFREVAPYLGDAATELLDGDFRRVVFTSPRTQLTVMTLHPGEEIGAERHADGDQLFVFLSGAGIAELDGTPRVIVPGCLMAIPAGTEHNIRAGSRPLRLVTVYAPPQHAAGTVHRTRDEAQREHKTAALVRCEAAVEHDEYPGRGKLTTHWFEDFDDATGESRGHAKVTEFPNRRAWVDELRVNPHERQQGVGGGLIDAVTDHFSVQDKPVGLLPSPLDDEHGAMEEEDLRDWYGRHGFEEGHDEEMHHDPWPRHGSAGHLRNPATGGLTWYHGTKASPAQMEHGFRPTTYNEEAERDAPLAHWNALLGVHFAAHHSVADKFAQHGAISNLEANRGNTTPSVIHARLGIRNPKVYRSEDHMSDEAYEHEYDSRKNYISNYLDEDGYGTHWNAEQFHGDDDPHERLGKHEMSDPQDYGDDSWYGEEPQELPDPEHKRTLWLNAHPDKEGIAARFRERLMAGGHDGIIYGNEATHERIRSHRPEANMAAIAFHPSQIRVTRHHPAGQPCTSQREAAWHDDDDEDEDGWDTCYHCQREHDPHDHSGRLSPDWDQVLPSVPSIHRSIGIALPEREHALVHDPATPPHKAAQVILRHLHETGLGHQHWSSPEGMEHNKRTFGSGTPEGYDGPWSGVTSVTLHAKTPHPHDIDDDEDSLTDEEISPHRAPEYEIPMAPGAPVHLTGMTWSKARTGQWGSDNRWHADPEPEERHHSFTRPIQITAASGCPLCGTETHEENDQGEILLHRGIPDAGGGRDWHGQPWKSAEHMMAEEGPGGDLDKEMGQWWGSRQIADFYGEGGKDSGLSVSAWFPKDQAMREIPGHEGHVLSPGTQGRVHEVRVRSGGRWQRLPHSPGMRVTARAWVPSAGIFGPTTGLDPVLFENGQLRPQVRDALLARLREALARSSELPEELFQRVRVYLAGGSASEWAGSRPNEQGARDLDILLGIDHSQHVPLPAGHAGQHDAEADIERNVNDTLRRYFNDDSWRPAFGGTWSLTGYCNSHAWNISEIHPYAAWDLTNSRWAVRPPHLPNHTVADFDPAVLRQARAVAQEARAILAQPEPHRSRQARALWERLHSERDRAFSDDGTGWDDPGNLIEKWLAYSRGHVLDQIRELAHGALEASRG